MIKTIFINEKKYPVSKSFINAVVLEAAKLEKKLKGIVEVVIVDNKKIRGLNRAWRGQDKITDVLSFVFSEDDKVPTEFLGQIFVSYPKISAQAKEYHVQVREELARMIVHGLLHLSGHTHNAKKQAKKMFDLQEKILSKVI